MSETEVQKENAEKKEELNEKANPEAGETEKKDEWKSEEMMALEKEIEKIKNEAEDFKKKYYYLAAEMENARRRFERERESLVKFGNEKVLSSLVEVVDNLERTLSAIGKDEDEKVKNIVVGINMVHGQFLNVLNQNGLKPVEALGKPFDPNFHEAMAQQKAEGKANDEIICEYQKGYVLNGRLLRASKVVVAKND